MSSTDRIGSEKDEVDQPADTLPTTLPAVLVAPIANYRKRLRAVTGAIFIPGLESEQRELRNLISENDSILQDLVDKDFYG